MGDFFPYGWLPQDTFYLRLSLLRRIPRQCLDAGRDRNLADLISNDTLTSQIVNVRDAGPLPIEDVANKSRPYPKMFS